MKGNQPSAELIVETLARILERKHGVKLDYELKQKDAAAGPKK